MAGAAATWVLGVKWVAALLAVLLAGCVSLPAPIEADFVIRGGTVYPGGAAPFTGDVAVRGDRILAVINEMVWRTQPDEIWVLFRMPGLQLLALFFSATQFPLMLKGAKAMEAEGEAETPPPA